MKCFYTFFRGKIIRDNNQLTRRSYHNTLIANSISCEGGWLATGVCNTLFLWLTSPYNILIYNYTDQLIDNIHLGLPDPLKMTFVRPSSTLVLVAGVPFNLAIEPRDEFNNLCQFPEGTNPTDGYSAQIFYVSNLFHVSFDWFQFILTHLLIDISFLLCPVIMIFSRNVLTVIVVRHLSFRNPEISNNLYYWLIWLFLRIFF